MFIDLFEIIVNFWYEIIDSLRIVFSDYIYSIDITTVLIEIGFDSTILLGDLIAQLLTFLTIGSLIYFSIRLIFYFFNFVAGRFKL